MRRVPLARWSVVLLTGAVSVGLGVGLGACSRDEPVGHDHDADPHAHHDGAEAGAHVHTAPHGGTLVVLSEEFAHVEFLLDPDAGTLTAYVLGAHADTPVRIEQLTLELTIGTGKSELALSLDAVGNPLTGEKPGDTSEFTVQHDKLTGMVGFDGVLKQITARGERFLDVPVHCH